MHPFLNIATRLSQDLGHFLTRQLETLVPSNSEKSLELTQKIYAQAEYYATEIIQKYYPEHGISTLTNAPGNKTYYLWKIDVINGRVNYARLIPHFAIVIGIYEKGLITHGLIYDPMVNELFTVTRGTQAQLNNRRIRMIVQQKLEDARLGFYSPDNIPSKVNHLKVYSTGCPSLLLGYTASGRLDGFIGEQLTKLEEDVGTLFIKSAGGLISDLEGKEASNFSSTPLIATNPKLLKPLLQSINASILMGK